MEDSIKQVRATLGLGDERDKSLTLDKVMPVLRQLASDVQNGQHAIGMVLWHLDPDPAQLQEIANLLHLKPLTLKSWANTYSRLRKDTQLAVLNFSLQQQLARIMKAEDRNSLWQSRDDWTLADLTQAVDSYMGGLGSTVMPRTKRAACVAKLDGRQVKVTLELLQESVVLKIVSSEGSPLSDMDFDQLSEGVYQLRFDW